MLLKKFLLLLTLLCLYRHHFLIFFLTKPPLLRCKGLISMNERHVRGSAADQVSSFHILKTNTFCMELRIFSRSSLEIEELLDLPFPMFSRLRNEIMFCFRDSKQLGLRAACAF